MFAMMLENWCECGSSLGSTMSRHCCCFWTNWTPDPVLRFLFFLLQCTVSSLAGNLPGLVTWMRKISPQLQTSVWLELSPEGRARPLDDCMVSRVAPPSVGVDQRLLSALTGR